MTELKDQSPAVAAGINSATPERLNVDITGQCNLRCRYCCFFGQEAEAGCGDLETGEWRRFFREAGAASVLLVTLRGGEPLMRGDLPELLREIAANRMRFRLYTNAMLMTDDLAGLIAETRRCSLVKVSLDGPPEIHDAGRGTGAYAATLKGLGIIRRHGLPLAVTAAVHRENFHRLPEILAHLIEDLDLPAVSLSGVVENTTTSRLGLRPEESEEAIHLLLPLMKRYRDRLLRRGLASVALRWRDMLRGKAGRAFGACSNVRTLMIRSDGVFTPCLHMAGVELGRINRDPLASVWLHSRPLNQLRAVRSDPGNFSGCRECRFRSCCAGWCPAVKPEEAICLARYLKRYGEFDGGF